VLLHLPKLRIDIELPKFTDSVMDCEDPILKIPKTEMPLPHLAAERIEHADPKFT
jgi:hypothetical protein